MFHANILSEKSKYWVELYIDLLSEGFQGSQCKVQEKKKWRVDCS